MAIVVTVLSTVSPICAQPDRQPYDLHLVVLLGDHRFLNTETFPDQFPRDLVQQTKLALGNLVRVDAATAHPLAEAIRRDGLAALDGLDEVSSRRTWFFVVRFQDGQFQLQGRFFDGLTGLAGPPTRTVTTSDRGRLAHLAARMIAESFPLVGTVTSAKGDSVELTLFGGQPNDVVQLPRGTVFAVSRIASEAGKLRATRLPWAVLEAKAAPTAGVVPCRFWHRFSESKIVRGDGVAYRALVMPTRSLPLTIQVIDRESSHPLAGIGVKISGGVKRDFDLVTDAAGRVTTPEKVADLAVVSLSQGGKEFAQFPIAVVDDRPVVCAVSTDPVAEELAGLEIRRHQLRVKILGTLQVVDQRFSEQGVLLQQSLERSLEYAQKTVAFLDREIADIAAEREEIRRHAKPGQKPEDGAKGVERLRQLRSTVQDSTKRIEQLIAERDRQTDLHNRGMKYVEQAALLESQALFDEALEAYAKAIELLPVPGKIKEKHASLRAAWEVKNKEHEQARIFLVKTWPKLDASAIPAHLVMAEKSLEVCEQVDDRLAPRRFLTSNVDHLANISQIVAKLHRSRTADDRVKMKSWTGSIETLQRLSIRASEQIVEKKS